MNYDELSTMGYFVRGDLMKKYGISQIKTTADLDKYLIAVAKNEISFFINNLHLLINLNNILHKNPRLLCSFIII